MKISKEIFEFGQKRNAISPLFPTRGGFGTGFIGIPIPIPNSRNLGFFLAQKISKEKSRKILIRGVEIFIPAKFQKIPEVFPDGNPIGFEVPGMGNFSWDGISHEKATSDSCQNIQPYNNSKISSIYLLR